MSKQRKLSTETRRVQRARSRFRATSFVGRRAELEGLLDLLERGRLVTVLGPPGIGKTRVAERVLEREGLGAEWHCDLTDAASVDDVCAAVGRTLDVPMGAAESDGAVALVGDALAARGPVLLCLDNFESVAACAAQTIAAWLEQALDARFLVTSRERLCLSGELVFDLGPLSLPDDDGDPTAGDAAQLFLERARAIGGGDRLVEEDAPAVGALVRRLDGNPLAIELAAARLRVLTASEILESLSRCLDMFARNAVDAPLRHASLRGAIMWSWEMLKPWEQAALAQFSVFRGGFGLQAASAVVDLSAYPGAPPAVDVLQALRDKSLIFRAPARKEPGRARFGLYACIRELGREKLAEMGGRDAAEARHARHFLEEARARRAEMDGPDGIAARRHVAAEAENLLAVHRRALGRAAPTAEDAAAAMEIALTLHAVLSMHGPYALLQSLLTEALGAPHALDVPAPLRARTLEARGHVQGSMGRGQEQQMRDLHEALALAESADDAALVGQTLMTTAHVLTLHGRNEEAEASVLRALRLASSPPAQRPGSRRLEGRALAMLGLVRLMRGRIAEAAELFERALRVHREAGDLLAEPMTTLRLALVRMDLGCFEEADACGRRAQQLFHETGHRRNEAAAIDSRALLEQARGRPELAEPLYREAVRMMRAIGARREEGIVLVEFGTLHETLDRRGDARDCYEQALDRLSGCEPAWHACALVYLGRLEADEGRVAEARAHFAEAEREGGHERRVREALESARGHLDLALARAALLAGDLAAAQQNAKCAQERLAAAGAEDVIESRLARGELARAIERYAAERIDAAPPSSGGSVPEHVARSAARSISRAQGAPPAGAGACLEVHGEGMWFRTSGGERVSLAHHRALCLLLQCLVARRLAAPGAALRVEELIAAGWPDERVHPRAGASRVYVAVHALRDLGLRGILVRRNAGYLIDPSVEIVQIDP